MKFLIGKMPCRKGIYLCLEDKNKIDALARFLSEKKAQQFFSLALKGIKAEKK